MINRCTVLLCVLMLSAVAVAQNTTTSTFQVKGVVLDSLTQEPEPYATIKIVKKETPARAVKMMVTDMQGRFQEKVTGAGNFVMTITSVGRTPIVKDFTVKAEEKTVDFGILYATDATNELAQVEVVAQKPLVKADIDKIEYNIQDDPDAQSNTLLEMLRKVPLVTVDGEDNIKVNGSANFKVHVNGRPNSLMSKNPKEVLRSMPANTIKHIEVITNPGPKYDAEGVGGILNIVTVGGGLEGYTATFTGRVHSQGGASGLFGTVKSGKLTVSGRYEYNYNDQPMGYSSGSRRTKGNISPTSSDVDYNGTNKRRDYFQSGNLEASYEIDTLRLLTMSVGLWGGGGKNTAENLLHATQPGTTLPLYRYTTNSRSKSSWYSIDGSIDYQRLFRVKERMLTLSYKINSNPETSDAYSGYTDMQAAADWQVYLNRLTDQHNDNSQHTTEHTFQIDYTTPFAKIHTLETGAKYILRDNSAENDRYERPAGGSGDYLYQQSRSSHYKHQNDILAAYAGYRLKVKKFSGRLGVRYEHTIQNVKYRLGRGQDFRKDLDDIVPSVSVGWKLTTLSNLRLGYSMRISRPGIWNLNPYLDDSNPSNIYQGNPDLTSEKRHAFDLGYSNFTQRFNFNASVRYSFTNNSIESYSELVPDITLVPKGLQHPTGKDVLYSTYRNLGKNREVGINGYINWNATSATRIYANMYLNYTYMEDGKGLKNDGWRLFTYGGAQQSLPHDWSISLNLYGQTPWVMLQGKGSSWLDYGLSINKSLLKKRLTLSVIAANFFHKYRSFDMTLEDANFRQESHSKYPLRRFGVSVSYRIGELTASVKKAARTITNDDVKGKENAGGGGN